MSINQLNKAFPYTHMHLTHGFLTWDPRMWFKALVDFADISITTAMIETNFEYVPLTFLLEVFVTFIRMCKGVRDPQMFTKR